MERFRMVLLSSSLAACMARGAPADVPVPSWRVFRGAADVSAAAFLDARTLVVADDEDNTLRFYDAERAGAPLGTLDLSEFLGLGRGQESDIEGAASSGARVYWITSHGRDRQGQERRARGRLFATERTQGSAGVGLRPVGRSYDQLLPALVAAVEPRGIRLGAAAGVNIEALAASADGAVLYIGFRNPLHRVDGVERAIVVPLLNPAAVVDQGAAPQLGPPLLWDLGGRGLRSMTWSESHRAYFLVSGATDGGPGWALHRWSGNPGEAPVTVEQGKQGDDVRPEALADMPGSRRLLALSDDGNLWVRVSGPAACKREAYRADGSCRNKHLVEPDRKTFRGFMLTP